MESEFPSNSNRGKAKEVKPDKVIESVVAEGRAVARKKTMGRRFSETFFTGDSTKTVFSNVIHELLIPSIKEMLSDALQQSVDQRLGLTSSRSVRRSGRSSSGYGKVTNYSAITSGRGGDDRQSMSRRARATHNFDEILLPTRVEAEEVIDGLLDLMARYESATVAELYSLANYKSSYTDEKYGWNNLVASDVGVSRTRDGYLLDLPKPELLD